jgi:ketosteroid isomerase-like protein
MGTRLRQDVNLCLNDGEIEFNQSGSNEFESGVRGNRMTAEEIVSVHTDMFNRALKEQDYAALEGLYAGDYMLVRPDGSVLNKQEVLQDLRSGGLRLHSIELAQTEERMYGSTAVLTAESQAVSSRHGKESRSHFRLIGVYVQQGQSIKLVHFQSTFLR